MKQKRFISAHKMVMPIIILPPLPQHTVTPDNVAASRSEGHYPRSTSREALAKSISASDVRDANPGLIGRGLTPLYFFGNPAVELGPIRLAAVQTTLDPMARYFRGPGPMAGD